MALVVFGLHNLRVDLVSELIPPWNYVFPQPISYATTIIYNCFQRVAWSLSLCWVIFSCSKGYGGMIANMDLNYIVYKESDLFISTPLNRSRHQN